MRSSCQRTTVVLGFAMVTAGWAAGVVGAPYLAQVSGVLSALLYMAGALICHQQPDRSFYLSGAQLPVCARCLGLYVGAAGGAAMAAWLIRSGVPFRSRRQALSALSLAAMPTAVSVGSAVVGLGDSSNTWRALLALPLGGVGALIVASMAADHLE